MTTADKAAERAGVLAVKLTDAEQRIARLECELEDARKAQEGANALLCDAQAEISTLQEQIEAMREANILMGATVRMFEDASRPFAEARRALADHGAYGVAITVLGPADIHIDLDLADFDRIAEMVPEEPNP